jgi:arginase family enzyme
VKEHGVARAVERVARLRGRPAYCSFDIDAVDPAYAPATGTPEVGGLTSYEALSLVRGLQGLDLVGADVVEVAPPYDGPGAITSLLAANLLFELLGLFALGKRTVIEGGLDGSLRASPRT